jgi:NAD(P)-dependent dehydrogenase (short-subunit alcohol dehydrogenase family)
MTTPQQPIDSGFGPATTSDDVLQGRDLSGRQAIVTDGYDGIGLETTRKLAKAGAQVTVPARSLKKAHAAGRACKCDDRAAGFAESRLD